jgi:hypothetical protein
VAQLTADGRRWWQWRSPAGSRASRSLSVDGRRRGRVGGGENAAHGRGRGGRGEKGGRAAVVPFMVARWHDREKGAGGPELKGGRAVSCSHATPGGAGGGSGHDAGREVRAATARERWCRAAGVHTVHWGERERHGASRWVAREKKRSGPSPDEQ